MKITRGVICKLTVQFVELTRNSSKTRRRENISLSSSICDVERLRWKNFLVIFFISRLAVADIKSIKENPVEKQWNWRIGEEEEWFYGRRSLQKKLRRRKSLNSEISFFLRLFCQKSERRWKQSFLNKFSESSWLCKLDSEKWKQINQTGKTLLYGPLELQVYKAVWGYFKGCLLRLRQKSWGKLCLRHVLEILLEFLTFLADN